MTTTLTRTPRKLRSSDLARLASVGLRTRKLRAGLSALGIAIGVAAIVAVLGLSSSSSAGLLAEIAKLGTNLLTVTPGQGFSGSTTELPDAAPGMIGRRAGVTNVQEIGTLSGVSVYRNQLVNPVNTNGLSVAAASLGMPGAVSTTITRGTYLNAATARQPVAVLGAAAARYLGIDRIWPGQRIWLYSKRFGGQWFYVTGILHSATLIPSIDASVFVGIPAAEQYLHFDGHPTAIYLRTQTDQVDAVYNSLPYVTNPEDPAAVQVTQPSAALVAQADAQAAFNTLFLGLGAVALLVGAVGVANIMVISVLERRSEIGLRRALGATKGHIRAQFLSEAILLAVLGGVAGDGAGVLATAIYAATKGWSIVIPPLAWGGGFGAALLIGAVAGLLPALRAARMPPTEALSTV
jgi:putative ABC transport system permease protein